MSTENNNLLDMRSFNYERFLRDKWHDPEGLLRFLHAYGHRDLRLPTVAQWFRRKSIPSEWFATLMTLLETEHGAPVSLAEYLE